VSVVGIIYFLLSLEVSKNSELRTSFPAVDWTETGVSAWSMLRPADFV